MFFILRDALTTAEMQAVVSALPNDTAFCFTCRAAEFHQNSKC